MAITSMLLRFFDYSIHVKMAATSVGEDTGNMAWVLTSNALVMLMTP